VFHKNAPLLSGALQPPDRLRRSAAELPGKNSATAFAEWQAVSGGIGWIPM
jgi:hypothetical protein